MTLTPRPFVLLAALLATALTGCDNRNDPRVPDISSADDPAMATGAGEVAGGALASPAAQTPPVQVTGMVTALDSAQRRITLEHEATPALGSVETTHSFPVAESARLEDIRVGQHVVFQVKDNQVIAIEEFQPRIQPQP